MAKKDDNIMQIVAPRPKASSNKMSKRGDKMPKEERKDIREIERKG